MESVSRLINSVLQDSERELCSSFSKVEPRKAYEVLKKVKKIKTNPSGEESDFVLELQSLSLRQFFGHLSLQTPDGVSKLQLNFVMLCMSLHFCGLMLCLHQKARTFSEAKSYINMYIQLIVACPENNSVHLATYQVKYARLLAQMGRFSEGAEQACLAKSVLISSCGEDYMDWLPDPPNCDFEEIRKTLDKITSPY